MNVTNRQTDRPCYSVCSNRHCYDSAQKLEILMADRMHCRRSMCVSVPNFVAIGPYDSVTLV